VAWSAGISAAILVGSLGWLGAFVSNYQPLRPEFTAFAFAPGLHRLGTHDFQPEVGVPCREGGHVRFGFPLFNEGPVGVTVTTLASAGGPEDVLSWRGISMGAPHSTSPGSQRPFRPFSLAPHDYRVVMWQLTIHACHGGAISPAVATIGFRVFGFGRRQDFDIPVIISISRTGRMKAF